MEGKKLLKAKDVAKRLNICYPMVLKMTKEGQIPSVKIGKSLRFDPDVLEFWLLENQK